MGREEYMYKSLLVALDGSKQSEKALILACHLARDDNAELHIVHAPEVLQHPAVMTWGLGSVILGDNDELQVTGNQIVERAVLEARELGVTHVHAHVVRGDPPAPLFKKPISWGLM